MGEHDQAASVLRDVPSGDQGTLLDVACLGTVDAAVVEPGYRRRPFLLQANRGGAHLRRHALP